MAYLCIRFGVHALPAHVIRMLKERHATPAASMPGERKQHYKLTT